MSARAAAVRSKTHRPRRRLAVFSLAALAVTGFAVWLAPAVAVLTNLRDRPLIAAFEGIDGTVASGSAKWNWLHGIEYRDVVINDHNGKTIAHLPLVQLDRGLLHLSFDLTSLGTVRLFLHRFLSRFAPVLRLLKICLPRGWPDHQATLPSEQRLKSAMVDSNSWIPYAKTHGNSMVLWQVPASDRNYAPVGGRFREDSNTSFKTVLQWHRSLQPSSLHLQ